MELVPISGRGVPEAARRRPFLERTGLLERQRLTLSSDLTITVKKKTKQNGTTPYQFSHSLKGENGLGPIAPEKLSRVALQLAERVISTPQTILVAVDRGGTAIGVALSEVSGIPCYIAVTPKGTPPQEGWIQWEEQGAGKALAIPPLPQGARIVFVDDIIDTGQTYMNGVRELKNRNIIVDQVITLAEVARPQMGRDAIRKVHPEVKVDALYTIPQPMYDTTNDQYIFPTGQ